MPKLVRAIPAYQRHRASGQAVVTLNGHDYYLGPHGTKASRLEYDRLIGEWLANGRRFQRATVDDGLTMVELIAAYLRFATGYYRKDGKSTSEIQAIKSALRPVKVLYGRHPARDFGPTALQCVRQKMIEAGWASGTINSHVSRIRRMFRWGVAQELIPPTSIHSLIAVDGLRAGRTEARETLPVPPVDDAVVDATLAHLPDMIADMVRFQRLTGMRPEEVCILRPGDLDRTGDIWQFRPATHKTIHRGRERVVFIGPLAQAILLPYLKREPHTYCFRPCESEAKRRARRHAERQTPLTFGNRPGTNRHRVPKRQPGERYAVDAYRRAIHRACDTAFPPTGDIARSPGESMTAWRGRLTDAQTTALDEWQSDHRWSPNQLRHSAATEIRRKFGLEAAATVLGHVKADVTQIYAERDYRLAANVARQMG